MLSLDDEVCIDGGICDDLLPQYFELSDGSVRIRAGAESGADRQQSARREGDGEPVERSSRT